MDDHDQLRELLHGAVPDPPAAAGRAHRARRYAERARRRRTVAASVGAAAVVAAVAVPMALHAEDDPGPGVQRGGDPTPSEQAELVCPQSASRGEEPAPVTGPDHIADGAVAVRLCAPYGGDWGLSADPPADALTAGARQVAAELNALPPVLLDDDRYCNSDGGPTWDLVFGYPNGSTQIARGSFSGCGGWQVGGRTRGTREDMDLPLDLFLQLLWDQRRARPRQTYDGAPPTCDHRQRTAMPSEAPLAAEALVLCWVFESESEQPRQRAVVKPEDAGALLRDLNANTTRSGGPTDEDCTDPSRPHLELAGVKRLGRRLQDRRLVPGLHRRRR